jgi:hypothetical protein
MSRASYLLLLTGAAGTLLPLIRNATPEPQPAALPAIIINEILVDPASGPDGDANRDGIRDTYQDEFIEMVNAGPLAVDMSGWQLGPDGADPFHFPSGTLLSPGAYLALFGGGDPTGLPGLAFTAGGRIGSGLSNTAGRILLVDPAGPDTLQDISYQGWDDDASFVRDPEGSGGFVDHLTRHGVRFSPARASTPAGGPFTDRPVLYRVRIVNLTSSGFQVSWSTGAPADGRLEVTAAGVLSHRYDPAPVDVMHLAGFYGLAPGTPVDWRLVSSGTVYPPDSTLALTTGTAAASVPYTVHGLVTGPAGPQPGARVFVRSESGASPTGWLSAESDSLGRWSLNLGNLRQPDGDTAPWGAGDTLLVEATEPAVGFVSKRAPVSGMSPQEIALAPLSPDLPPDFRWLAAPSPTVADSTLTVRYALVDDGPAWARPYLRDYGGSQIRFLESEPPLLTPTNDGQVVVRVESLPEGSRWWIGAQVADDLNPPVRVESAVPVRIAHALRLTREFGPGVTLFTPRLDDAALRTAGDWLDRFSGDRELARWDSATASWASLVQVAEGTRIGDDFALSAGVGYALITSEGSSLAVHGSRLYEPPSRILPVGMALAGISDSTSARPASAVLANGQVRSVSRWEPNHQLWEGRFRLPDGGQFGVDFPIDWGDAVAIDVDSVAGWQPGPPPRAPAPVAEAGPTGRQAASSPDARHSDGCLLASSPGPGTIHLLWRSAARSSLSISLVGSGSIWQSGAPDSGGWREEHITGLRPGIYDAVLEIPGPHGTGRLIQRVAVASAGPPAWPEWAWGLSPTGSGPLLLQSGEAVVPVGGQSADRWYVNLSHPDLRSASWVDLLRLAGDGGWTRWPLALRADGQRPGVFDADGEPISLSGLVVESVGPHGLHLDWQVLHSDRPLTFRVYLGYPAASRMGSGPPGDPRSWKPEERGFEWTPQSTSHIRQLVRVEPDVDNRGLPEAVAVRVVAGGGRAMWLGPVPLEVTDAPGGVELLPAVPNPFNPRTHIRYRIPDGQRPVRLEIRDVRGRRTRLLVEEEQGAGTYQVIWDGRDGWGRRAASGVYFVVLQAGGTRRIRKVLLLR